tara:strand:+ start:34 stop:570 length:537 start_codon:yes stop_codon:yes gene_type:complete
MKGLKLKLGITGRDELCCQMKLHSNQKIFPEIKGKLKSMYIKFLIERDKLIPNTVHFFDDNIDAVHEVSGLGVQTGLITKQKRLLSLLSPLLSSEEKNNISTILLDFDQTISVNKFKKRNLEKNSKKIIKEHFGGFERYKDIYTILKKFEDNNVNIGIITFQTSEVIKEVLYRIEWIK